MSEVFERNWHDVKLESGLLVTIELPWMRDFIFMGDVPLPALEEMENRSKARMKAQEEGKPEPKFSDEDRRADLFNNYRIGQAAVAWAIRRIEGEPVTITADQLHGALTEEEFDELLAYVRRTRDVNTGEA